MSKRLITVWAECDTCEHEEKFEIQIPSKCGTNQMILEKVKACRWAKSVNLELEIRRDQ